jgi:hypothetical protein
MRWNLKRIERAEMKVFEYYPEWYEKELQDKIDKLRNKMLDPENILG